MKYTIILESQPSEVDPDRRLAQFLKDGGRMYKFKCRSVVKLHADNRQLDRAEDRPAILERKN